MASKAILRRKQFVSRCLDAYPRSIYAIRSIQSLLQEGNALHDLDSRNYSSHSEVSSSANFSFQRFKHLNQTYGTSVLGLQRDQNVGISSLGLGRNLCSVRYAHIDAAQEQADSDFSSSQEKAKSKLLLWLIGIALALRLLSYFNWDKLADSLMHYWLGTKLFWADVRICSRLLLKLEDGKSLSKRERKQLTRTAADIFTLFPFTTFMIVPFMEYLVRPVILKLRMLPSTFQDKMKQKELQERKIKARIEYAKLFQDTAREMAREVQISMRGESETKRTAEDLYKCLNKVRRSEPVSNDEILGFAKLFNDELTLDNIRRPRLVSMCMSMGISSSGTDANLRFLLHSKLQRIKENDKLIQAEGVESLSEAELHEHCRERGMLELLPVEEMRKQLRDWLDLSLNHCVPSSILILSRPFTVPGAVKPLEAVGATLSSLPDEVVKTVAVTSLRSQHSVSQRKRKLKYLAMQEELIKEEEKQEGEDLFEISRVLAVSASASPVSREHEEFLELANKEIELLNYCGREVGGIDSEKQHIYYNLLGGSWVRQRLEKQIDKVE